MTYAEMNDDSRYDNDFHRGLTAILAAAQGTLKSYERRIAAQNEKEQLWGDIENDVIWKVRVKFYGYDGETYENVYDVFDRYGDQTSLSSIEMSGWEMALEDDDAPEWVMDGAYDGDKLEQEIVDRVDL